MNIKHIVAMGALTVSMGITGCTGLAQNQDSFENLSTNARLTQSAYQRGTTAAKAARNRTPAARRSAALRKTEGSTAGNAAMTSAAHTTAGQNYQYRMKSLAGYADAAVSTNLSRTARDSNVADSGLVNKNIFGQQTSRTTNTANLASNLANKLAEAKTKVLNNSKTYKTTGSIGTASSAAAAPESIYNKDNTAQATENTVDSAGAAVNDAAAKAESAVKNTADKAANALTSGTANSSFSDPAKERVYSGITAENKLIAENTGANGVVRKNYISQTDYKERLANIKTEEEQNNDIVPTFNAVQKATADVAANDTLTDDKNRLDGSTGIDTADAHSADIVESETISEEEFQSYLEENNLTVSEENESAGRSGGGSGEALSSTNTTPDDHGLPRGSSVYELGTTRERGYSGITNRSGGQDTSSGSGAALTNQIIRY